MDDFNLFDKDEEKIDTTTEKVVEESDTKSKTDIPTIGSDGIIEGNYVDITNQSNGNRNSYYSETIKNDEQTYKHSSFKRFIAGVLIASIIGGPMIGVGMQIGKPFAENIIAPMLAKRNVENKQNFSFVDENIKQINTSVEDTSISPAKVIAKNVGPSVVGITSTILTTDFFNRAYNSDSNGSGIIFNIDNEKVYIVTNNHVIEGAKTVVVTLSGDQKVEATIVGGDRQTDLAVISLDKADMTQESIDNLVIAKFGDSSKLEVGELAVAIGNPLGLAFSNSVTQGIISGIDRQIQVEDRNLTMIQTDAAINPGNSGGALVNSKSEVIGINTIKYSDSKVEGMGFAIPTNIAKPIIEELMNNGYISRPYLGIRGNTITEELSQIYNLPIGVLVSTVTPNGPAALAGIQSNDIITEFNGEKITSMDQLTSLLKKYKVSDKVSIGIIRNGSSKTTVTVILKDSGLQRTAS